MHRVRSVGHYNELMGIRADFIMNKLTIFIRKIQAILAQYGLEFVFEINIRLSEYLPNPGLSHLIGAFLVEVNLVNGAACGKELDFHVSAHSISASSTGP